MTTYTLNIWNANTGEISQEFHDLSWQEVMKYMNWLRTLNILGPIHVDIHDTQD
jgi:hypothetical protein